MLKALHDEPYSLHDFSQFTGYLKSLLPLFGIYGLILAGGVFALQAMIHLGAVLLVLPALLGVGVIFLNCINHLTLFSMIETHQSAWRALKGGTKLFFQSGKLIMHIVLKTIVLILLGSLAVYVLNVFVYAPQIDAVLKSTPEITGSPDRSLFLNESQLYDSKRWHAAGCQLYRNRVRHDLWRLLFKAKESNNEIKEFIRRVSCSANGEDQDF